MKYAAWKDDPKGKRKGRSTPKAHKRHLARLKANRAKLEAQSQDSDRLTGGRFLISILTWQCFNTHAVGAVVSP